MPVPPRGPDPAPGDGDVDWDLLAEHLGGALIGTPQAAEVTRLIATDPQWQQAAAELAGAFDAVAVDLRALPEPAMPDEVTARLDAVLRGTAVSHPPAPAPRSGGASASSRPADRRPPTRQSRSRRRFARWGAGMAVAASVLAFTAIGFDNWQRTPEFRADQDADAGTAPESLSAAPPTALGDTPTLLASGLDYQQSALRQPVPIGGPSLQAEQHHDQSGPPAGTAGPGESLPPNLPAELAPLWSDPQLRTDCLAAVTAEFPPDPVMVETVDFARFEGEAALVIWITTPDGSQWVSISGAACGSPASGADQRFVYPLG